MPSLLNTLYPSKIIGSPGLSLSRSSDPAGYQISLVCADAGIVPSSAVSIKFMPRILKLNILKIETFVCGETDLGLGLGILRILGVLINIDTKNKPIAHL